MSAPSLSGGGVSYAAAAAANSSSINNPTGNLEAAVRMQQQQQREQMQRLWKGGTSTSTQCSPPTAFTLRAALLLLQPAVAGDTVYLMDADYLQNWLVWAMHQAVPPPEARRVREALRLAALAQGLVPPPIAEISNNNNTCNSIDSNNNTSNNINNNNSHDVTQEEADYYNEYYGSYMEPGPVDATMLSVEGHPLVLQPTVRVMRKQHAATSSDHPHHHHNESQAMTAARLNQHHLQLMHQQTTPPDSPNPYASQHQQHQQPHHHRRILSSSNNVGYGGRDDDSTTGGNTSEAAATYSEAGAATSPSSNNNNNMSMMAAANNLNCNIMNCNTNNAAMQVVECLVVPEAFYEALRSVHGVLCEDGYSVSFQPGEREAHLLHHQIHYRKPNTPLAQQQQQEAAVIEQQHNDHIHHHHHPNDGGVEVVVLEEEQQHDHHNGTANASSGNHYHHHHYHNGSSSNNSTSSPRPIEFRRKVIWQILPPRLPLPPAPPPTEVETAQSVAAMLMQKANLFNKNKNANKNNKQGDAQEVSLMDKLLHQEELRKQPMRIPVPEIHPIKLHYRILTDRLRLLPPYGTTATAAATAALPPTPPNTLSGGAAAHYLLRPTDGFALVSKESTAVDALAALLRAAQPQAATQTVRLWCKRSFTCSSSNALSNGGHAAAATGQQRNALLPPLGTVRGDAYELVDLNDLTVDRAKTATEYISSGASVSSAASSAKEPLVVADWVLRQVVPKCPDDNNNNSKNNVNQINEVECLIECRSTVNAPWPRQGMELENRVSVGDFVDAQDVAGKWYEAVVLAVGGDYDDNASKTSTRSKNAASRSNSDGATAGTDDSKLKDTVTVHYLGWASRWNAVLKRHKHAIIPGPANKLKPIAPLWSRTRAWREQIRVNDIVEVRDSSSIVERPKWYRGVVKKVGRPNDAVREIVGGADLELFPTSLTSRHLPDLPPDKKKSSSSSSRKKEPLLLLARTQQILVEVDQEKTEKAGMVPTSPGEGDLAAGLNPQPPFLRWVNLFGEEVCELGTHLKIDDEMKAPALLKYECESGRKPVEILKAHPSLGGTGFVRESLRGAPPAPGSVGLHNLGNSCFLNSTVQCLNHMEAITQYFLRDRYGSELNRKNPLGSGGNVAVAYASLLKKMWGGEYSVLAPRMLKQTVATFAPQFDNSYQHDSQEFCSFLLDGIHEDLNRVKQKPYVEELEGFGMKDQKAAIESWRKHLLRHDSIIVDHCQGMHRSHLTCPQCGRESIKFDVFSSISLPLAAKKDRSTIQLSDCIEMFMEGEQLDERNAWYCPKCRRHVCALKMIALWSSPDILILHLKRFTFDTCMTSGGMLRSKVDDKVDFPIEGLDLTKYILGPIDPDAPPVYNLFGVSEHMGPTANSGHYTATVRNSIDGQWYRCNDSHVGLTSGEASITGGAYVLFYQRVKGLSRWAGMEKVMKEQGVSPYGGLEIDKDGFKKVKSKKKKPKGSSR